MCAVSISNLRSGLIPWNVGDAHEQSGCVPAVTFTAASAGRAPSLIFKLHGRSAPITARKFGMKGIVCFLGDLLHLTPQADLMRLFPE
jgi:hypothetical protein